ncbi:MAG: hypothetical protein LBM63_01685 [Rikenellaceae bacterium]|jgi:hypothetical protein|nr:hypothetical protein [Rikenellaceae bacterium]
MKKLLLIGILALCGFVTTGCNRYYDGEKLYIVDYVYCNESSSRITITIYSDIQYSAIRLDDYSQSIINEGEHRTFSLDAIGGYPRPFHWLEYSLSEYYVEISNGEKTVVQSRGDQLFLPETYTTTYEYSTRKEMTFVFTDEFFENGEPIER